MKSDDVNQSIQDMTTNKMRENERIRELAIQSGLIAPYGSDHEGLRDFDYRKFAELVREDEGQAIEEAEKQEPVAWMCETNVFGSGGWKRSLCFVRNDNECFRNWEPLFTAPVHASDISQERVDETAKCEHDWGSVTDDALIEEVRRRGFTIRDAQISPKIKDEYELCCQKYDTCVEPCTPRGRHLAKREWVGLTDEERSYYLQSAANVGWWQAALFVEAKLKEKNGG